MRAIPLADARALHAPARRTLLVRTALALALVGAVVATVLVARHPHTQTIVVLPAHSSAIVVLDLSASISADTYSRIGATLSSLARSRGRYGLVVFSDQAYEALPPGTPAADLAPLVRYFTLPVQKTPGFAPGYPPNPWQSVFSAGTQISSGLELAHTIAVQDALRRPAVILVSDLDDDPQDLPRLTSIVLALARDRIPLRIVGLDPSPQNTAFFQNLVGPGNPIVQAGALAPGPLPRNHTPFPWTIVVLALAIAAALAANELWGPRLAWAQEAAA
jgi:hypothetical protein